MEVRVLSRAHKKISRRGYFFRIERVLLYVCRNIRYVPDVNKAVLSSWERRHEHKRWFATGSCVVGACRFSGAIMVDGFAE